MNTFVLDNSVSMRWCFRTNANAYADSILKQLITGSEARVPALWRYEVVSVLAKAQKELALTLRDAADFMADLSRLGIFVDPNGPDKIFIEVHRLAVNHRLTGYDAAYLELAIRERIPLATLDDELIRACKAIGHPLAAA